MEPLRAKTKMEIQNPMNLDLPSTKEEMTDLKEIVNNNNIYKQVDYNAHPLDLAYCQNQLKAYYRTNRSEMGFLPGMPKVSPVDDFFVDLTLIKEDKRPTHVKDIQLEKYTDLLSLESQTGRILDHVIVTGEEGTGKTTLINKFAYQWATQTKEEGDNLVCNKIPYPFSRFQLVFALAFKTLKPKMDLLDWIQDQLLPEMPKLVIKSLLATHADKCLFLFDGYDESRSHQKALDSKLLLCSFVVVTSRLDKAEDFFENHTGYVQVQLAGFSGTSRETFVTKYLNANSKESAVQREPTDRANILLEKIYNTHLNYFSFHPLLLAMICIIWNKVGDLPTRISALYKRSLEISATQIYGQDGSEKAFTSHDQKLYDVLIHLGPTALDGLLLNDKKLIFEKEDFKAISRIQFLPNRFWVALSGGCLFACLGMEIGLRFGSVGVQLALALLGLIIGCAMFLIRILDFVDLVDDAENLRLLKKIHGNIKESSGIPQYSFIHKTFQEFCAAVFWTSLVESDREKFECYLKHIDRGNVYDMQYLLRFCCGLSGEAAAIILHYVVNDCKLDWRLPVTLLFEAESDSHIQPKLHAILRPVKILKTYSTMSSNLWATLYHYLNHKGISGQMQTWLTDIEELCVHIPRTRMNINQMLSRVTESVSFSRSLQALSLDISHPLNDKVLTIFLRQQLQLCHLKIECRTSPSISPLFSRLLPKPNRTAYANAVTYFDIVIPNLQSLSLVNAGIDIHQWERLLDIFTDAGKRLQMQPLIGLPDDLIGEEVCLPMRELDLKGNDLFTCNEDDQGDALLHKCAEALSYLSDLEHLGLNNTGLTSRTMQILGPAISRLSDLQVLDLGRIKDNTTLLHKAGTELSRCLHDLEDLSEYDLHCAGVSDDDFGMLSFERLPDLSELNVSCNAFGSQGLLVCSASLKHVPNLSKLKLSDNDIGDQGVIAFSASLQQVPLLTSLDLSGMKIGVQGLLAISASMKPFSLLTNLKLNGSKIGVRGALGYRALLQHIPLLKCLGINDINSECLIALSDGFCHIPRLTKLELLSGVQISVDAAEAVFKNLIYLPVLSDLSFPHIDYTNLVESKLVAVCLQGIPNLHDENVVYLGRVDIESIVGIVTGFPCAKK